MRLPTLSTLVFALAAFSVSGLAAPREAEAQSWSPFYKTYKVQVEYWFFDTDYYYWGTKFETSNLDEALLFYELLLIAKENGELNEVVPAYYGRYIAMDVRMITVYHYPEFERSRYDLQLRSAAIRR